MPTRHQLSRVLRELPNDAAQFLLDSSIQVIRDALPPELAAHFGDVVAGDTKRILAWVKESNPKQYIKEGHHNPKRQPKGDPDGSLGAKQRRNRGPDDAPPAEALPTPTSEAVAPGQKHGDAEYYWGYASGVVATRLPDHTEVVLAERTRPFNESDPSYFFPLMEQVEARLGRRPRFGTWDAAFDAHYVYGYFHEAGGFAAVPFNHGPQPTKRQFAADGAPLCAAGLAMTLAFTYAHHTGLVPHDREKFRCPVLHPTPTGSPCPCADDHFANGGCTSTIAKGPGSRIRSTLDRDSAAYTTLYDQRTMVERINSQAEAVGILHPKLRRGRAIVNQNSLI